MHIVAAKHVVFNVRGRDARSMSGRARRSLALRGATLLLVVGGCLRSSAPAPPLLAAPLVTVERDTYHVRRIRGGDALALTIVATFTNRTTDTIVLQPCNDPPPAAGLDKWVDGQWRPAFGQVCADIAHLDAPRLAPGQSRTDTLLIAASLRANTYPRFELATVPGLYRVVYFSAHRNWISGHLGQPHLGPRLPKELRVSNAFRVVE
jgi:hypothetical protein